MIHHKEITFPEVICFSSAGLLSEMSKILLCSFRKCSTSARIKIGWVGPSGEVKIIICAILLCL